LFFDTDRHQDIDGNGDPELGFHRIDRGPEERLNPEMLLDPFEEKFHLPAVLVQLTDGQRRYRPIICQEDEGSVGLRIVVRDTSELIRVSLLGIEPRQDTDLITAEASRPVDRVWAWCNACRRRKSRYARSMR